METGKGRVSAGVRGGEEKRRRREGTALSTVSDAKLVTPASRGRMVQGLGFEGK